MSCSCFRHEAAGLAPTLPIFHPVFPPSCFRHEALLSLRLRSVLPAAAPNAPDGGVGAAAAPNAAGPFSARNRARAPLRTRAPVGAGAVRAPDCAREAEGARLPSASHGFSKTGAARPRSAGEAAPDASSLRGIVAHSARCQALKANKTELIRNISYFAGSERMLVEAFAAGQSLSDLSCVNPPLCPNAPFDKLRTGSSVMSERPLRHTRTCSGYPCGRSAGDARNKSIAVRFRHC